MIPDNSPFSILLAIHNWKDDDMTAEELRTLCRRQPFVPFRIHMSNGQAFLIETAEFIAAGDEAAGVLFRTADGRLAATLVSLINIKTIEDAPHTLASE